MPTPPAVPPDARAREEWRRLRWRWLTAAGNGIAVSVASGATTLALTWPLTESTATYGVQVTPSWNTTVWVTNKTVTGCTVHFGTAPSATSPIDVSTFHA